MPCNNTPSPAVKPLILMQLSKQIVSDPPSHPPAHTPLYIHIYISPTSLCKDFDVISVDGVEFCGQALRRERKSNNNNNNNRARRNVTSCDNSGFPSAVTVFTGSTITWRSDYSVNESGWMICVVSAAPTSSPTRGYGGGTFFECPNETTTYTFGPPPSPPPYVVFNWQNIYSNIDEDPVTFLASWASAAATYQTLGLTLSACQINITECVAYCLLYVCVSSYDADDRPTCCVPKSHCRRLSSCILTLW
jgi:hypothetical protein